MQRQRFSQKFSSTREAICYCNVSPQCVAATCRLLCTELKYLWTWGEGRYSRFQVTGMIKWGQKSKPKKSHADFPSHKNFQSNYTARTCGSYHESSDCFEYPKKSLIKSSHPKKYLLKFSYPNKIPKSKISNPKKSFDHPCHLKFGAPPPPSWVMDPPSPRWTLFLAYKRIDSINKVAVTLSNLLFFLLVKKFSNVVNLEIIFTWNPPGN